MQLRSARFVSDAVLSSSEASGPYSLGLGFFTSMRTMNTYLEECLSRTKEDKRSA